MKQSGAVAGQTCSGRDGRRFHARQGPAVRRLTLNDDELALYQQIYAQLKPQAPSPDLVIYLQASPRP